VTTQDQTLALVVAWPFALLAVGAAVSWICGPGQKAHSAPSNDRDTVG